MTPPALTTLAAQASSRWEAAVRLWPEDAARDWTRLLVAAAGSDTGVQAVVATGSAVRDVDRSDDLDLVLVHRGARPDLSRPPISVDLRCYDRADVATKLAGGHSYLSWAVRFGRPLFERGRWWSDLSAAWSPRLVVPSPVEATRLAQQAERYRDALADAGDDDASAEMALSALTHRARAALSTVGVFPQSRPELARQLRLIGEHELSERLKQALVRRQK